MTVVILVGLPGCGKSTWLAGRGITAISSDEIRRILTGDATNQTVNARVFGIVRYLLRQRLDIEAETTYIDATNLTRNERRQYIKIARQFGAEIEAVYFDVPLEVCKQRNLQRSRVVPGDAMNKLAAKLQPPALQEGFSRITVVSDRTHTTASAGAARQVP